MLSPKRQNSRLHPSFLIPVFPPSSTICTIPGNTKEPPHLPPLHSKYSGPLYRPDTYVLFLTMALFRYNLASGRQFFWQLRFLHHTWSDLLRHDKSGFPTSQLSLCFMSLALRQGREKGSSAPHPHTG